MTICAADVASCPAFAPSLWCWLDFPSPLTETKNVTAKSAITAINESTITSATPRLLLLLLLILILIMFIILLQSPETQKE